MNRSMTLTSQRFYHPLLAASVMVCAVTNVAGADDGALRAKYPQPDFQPPAFNMQPGFGEEWVPKPFGAGNFGGQFRVRYEEAQEPGSIESSAAPYSSSSMPALIGSDKEPIGLSQSANFHGQLRYDIDSLWLSDEVEGGVAPNINSYDAREIVRPARHGSKRFGSAVDPIAPFSSGDYIEGSVAGADRAWYHRVAHPQFSLKF